MSASSPCSLDSRFYRLRERMLCLCLTLVALLAATGGPIQAEGFRVGAAVVDISPTNFPVLVNAMFTERTATQTVDRLNVRALVLDDGATRVAIAVVDTCMMPRDLIDRAKASARLTTGIPVERILVSATHTHSAPSAMGCLGSRVDPRYAAFLPGRIAQAIELANRNLEPAEVGWGTTNDWDHTFNRRWIRRPDRLLNDPFGQPTVRAHMHPGHQSPDAIGPSGPVDPGLSVVAFRSSTGRPLAVLANYSQHYYGSELLSSDYYGKFADELARLLRPTADDGAGGGSGVPFVGIMSQGTSGDLMWMDYGAPRNDIGYLAYAKAIAGRVHQVYQGIAFRKEAPLRMAERRLSLGYRVPDDARLAWARGVAASLGDRLPSTQPEIYALEAVYLHERPRTELILQALRIGDLGIAAIPNEVYAITGLKLKAASPLQPTFNMELANGAEGYIPPPEQHGLGGYTTWPARTAGLEVGAEPRIVETLTQLLEEVSGKRRREPDESPTTYGRAVLASRPLAYWPLNEIRPGSARDASGHGAGLAYESGVAVYLPGVGSGEGVSPQPQLTASAFSLPDGINRAPHFAGGRLRTSVGKGAAVYTTEFWFWNGLTNRARPVTGYLFSKGQAGDLAARGDHLGIGGTDASAPAGRLFAYNGNEKKQLLLGTTILPERTWHHVVLVRSNETMTVYLDGRTEPEIAGALPSTMPEGAVELFFGGRNDGFAGLEGRIDEVAVYDRALTSADVAAHFAASGLPQVAKAAKPATLTPPLSPMAGLASIQVPEGFLVAQAAAEPLVIDPVAIDWDVAGRLWVVEMADYPLGMDGNGKPGGRIRMLEDTDGDLRYDKSTLFAEDLNFPNGILTWRDGVLVTAAPDLLFLKDTDGDGRADVRQVLWTGFMQDNQQLRFNGLQWGLDNWIYCASGGHHRGHGAGTKVRSPATGMEVLLGSRDFRFRPETGELDPQSGPTQFGRNRDDWGNWFGTQNSWPLWHYVLADHYARRNPYVAAPDPVNQVVRPMNPQVFPASRQEKRYHSFGEAGHFTSACGGMIYRDDVLLSREGVMHGFTCEPFHNLVHHAVVRSDGVSFSATRDPAEASREFFASTDRWCRPVLTRTGPDGALWVVDMYRYMIEHPQWLPPEGREELLPHYREGDDKGRIYRVFPKDKVVRAIPRLDRMTTAELVAVLESPNGWQRDKAHQLLLWRGDLEAVPLLQRMATASTQATTRLHALCVLDGLNRLQESQVVSALADVHPGVRANALRLAETRGAESVVTAALRLIDDPDSKVRLQLALSLGAWSTDEASRALGSMALKPVDDTFFPAAIMSSALHHLPALSAAVGKGGDRVWSVYGSPLLEMASSLGQMDSMAALLNPAMARSTEPASPGPVEVAIRFLEILAKKGTPLADVRRSAQGAMADAVAKIDALLAEAPARAKAESLATAVRIRVARLMTLDDGRRAEGLSLLAGHLRPQNPVEDVRSAIAALVATADHTVPEMLLKAWDGFGPETRTVVLDALSSRVEWANAIMQAVVEGRVRSSAFDAARQTRFLRHSDERVRESAKKVFGAPSASARAQVIEAYRPALKLTGDARHGAEIYAKLCVVCHRREGQGNEVGPDLRSVVEHAPEKLLTNILDPSLDVQPGFQAFACTLKDGEELYGVIAAETGNSVVLKLVDGKSRTVLRSDITEFRGSGLSLMPDGLENGLAPQDLADLIALLKSR
ncbi:MAG: HEAT repeat domain-containing protein [Verrucomicrobiales bacterium]|nr:HEAT repeat domain-containing protein [Verrucomicrobiales bacterium]